MIGERAAKILLQLIESKVRPHARSVILDPSLVVRSSTLRLPQAVGDGIPSQPKTNSRKRVAALKRVATKKT
jgi:hypothetical protein